MPTVRLNKDLNGTKYIMLLLCCMVLTVPLCQAVTRELTLPRIGDRVTISRLSKRPGWLDTLSMCPDLSQVTMTASDQMSVWPPVKSDTLSSHYIIRGRLTISLLNRADTLLCHEVRTYGRSRYFDSYPVYGIPHDTITDRIVSSHGNTDNIGAYSTSGRRHIVVADGLKAVSTAGEILDAVVCVTTNICDTLTYESGDKYLYKADTKEWYAPGYRYPILENEAGTLVSVEGDTIDVVDNWYAIDTAEQDEHIHDDHVNELIRNNNKNRNRGLEHPSGNHVRRHVDTSGRYVNYDADESLLKITAGDMLNNNAVREYVMCDVSGIVYAAGTVNAQEINISTADMHNGTYIVCLTTESDPIVYKFTINN